MESSGRETKQSVALIVTPKCLLPGTSTVVFSAIETAVWNLEEVSAHIDGFAVNCRWVWSRRGALLLVRDSCRLLKTREGVGLDSSATISHVV